jgi:hypothetical protein
MGWRSSAPGIERQPMIPRRKLHRAVFIAAGFYNIIWGIFTVLDPQWLFRFSGMTPLNHPEAFACLGMVIGLYGVIYWEVARRPEQGFVIAAVGLTGKVLGPIGLAWNIYLGTWPAASAIMCLTNDIIWWVPFGLYLYDARGCAWHE